jgi:hypothetical protein
MRPFDFEEAIGLLMKRGLDEALVRHNSIVSSSLEFIRDTIAAHLRPTTKRPLIGLHVGNYVGVSLAGFADALRSIEPGSTVLAVDPNDAVELGFPDPQNHVIAVLEHFGLLGSVLLVCGFSFARSGSASGENVLPQIERMGTLFDVALIDGQHTAEVVGLELEFLTRRLRPGGIAFLDDANDPWPEVRDTYREWIGGSYAQVAHDGRVGALVRLLG